MLHRLILLFALVSVLSPMHAQLSEASHARSIFGSGVLGVQAGLGISNLKYQIDGAAVYPVPDPVYYPYFGLFFNIPITDVVAFRPEIGVAFKGSSNTWSGPAPSSSGYDQLHSTEELKITSLDIPLYLDLTLTKGLHFVCGPRISYIMAATLKEKHILGSTNPYISVSHYYKAKTNFVKEMNRLEAGINVGGYYEFAFGMSLNVGYGIGMNDIMKSDNLELKTRMTSIGLGYRF
ncbi:outer membrane beta-barrel protein [Alkaliflexus imshenetskii]|uniref:outer membrane beta-barrel protein n=1 Tax=Alkaliflexus imshenetskii TaxID=286730 RepID=UPI000A0557C3|nr:outer membrane beta-barrel protein [Alkaliflexus imshenetskii]